MRLPLLVMFDNTGLRRTDRERSGAKALQVNELSQRPEELS